MYQHVSSGFDLGYPLDFTKEDFNKIEGLRPFGNKNKFQKKSERNREGASLVSPDLYVTFKNCKMKREAFFQNLDSFPRYSFC